MIWGKKLWDKMGNMESIHGKISLGESMGKSGTSIEHIGNLWEKTLIFLWV